MLPTSCYRIFADPHAVAAYAPARAGRVRQSDGGRRQALALLPADVARRLECIRPTSLSDVDFLLMLDPV